MTTATANRSGRLLRMDSHDDGVNRWSMMHLAPSEALADAIRSYCDYSEHTRSFTCRRELPHAEGVLIFNLGAEVSVTGGDGREIRLGAGAAFIAGIHLKPALSRSSGMQSGIQIDLPLSTVRRLSGIPMDRLLDRVVPLEAILGDESRVLGQDLCNAPDMETRIAILDEALRQRMSVAAALDRRLMRALDLLRFRPDLDIVEVAAQVGWSRKHLADRARDAVGVGPRTFRRLLRFHGVTGVLARRPVRDWASFALDGGYCDQSHLIREFREFAGMTPAIFAEKLLGNGGGLVEH